MSVKQTPGAVLKSAKLLSYLVQISCRNLHEPVSVPKPELEQAESQDG